MGIFNALDVFLRTSSPLLLEGGITSVNIGVVFRAEQGSLSGVNSVTKNEWNYRLTPREVGGGSAKQPLRIGSGQSMDCRNSLPRREM